MNNGINCIHWHRQIEMRATAESERFGRRNRQKSTDSNHKNVNINWSRSHTHYIHVAIKFDCRRRIKYHFDAFHRIRWAKIFVNVLPFTAEISTNHCFIHTDKNLTNATKIYVSRDNFGCWILWTFKFKVAFYSACSFARFRTEAQKNICSL